MKLKSTTNTMAMARRVVRAFNQHFRTRQGVAIFEHGQWWVEHRKTGEQWSVVDAEGPNTTNGFDFEQVTWARE